MATFLENARLISKGISSEPWKSHFNRVFEAINHLQRIHSKAYFDIHNLEAVFTILETARTVGKLPGFKADEIPAVLESFKSVITYTLDATSQFPVDSKSETDAPMRIRPSSDYLRFVQLIQMLQDVESGITGVSIITFNYDIALDFALRSARIYPDYCLPKRDNESTTIKLLKLHGSLNLGRPQDNEDIVHFDQLEDYSRGLRLALIDQPSTSLNVGASLPALIQERWEINIEPPPVIVPPGFYKTEQHEALKDVC